MATPTLVFERAGGQAAAGPPWELGSVPLRFQIGDLILAAPKLALFRRHAGFDEPGLAVDETPVAPPRLDGVDGYVVWSQPILTQLPILRTNSENVLYAPRQYRRFLVDLSGSFDDYLASFSGKSRSGLKRKLNKLAAVAGGEIDWREYRTAEELEQFFPLAKRLSAKTYQERLLRSGLPDDRGFVARTLDLARTDAVRAYLLFLNGEPISYLFCPVRDGILVYDHLGYDPAYARLSPGTVLQLLALQALFAERRFRLFDFTEGEGQHKETFATHSVLCADVFVVNRRLRPLSCILLQIAADKTSAAAGRALDRLRLKPRLRRLLRRL